MIKVSTLEKLLAEIKVTEENRTEEFLQNYKNIKRKKTGDENEGIAKKIFDKSFPRDLSCQLNTQVKYHNQTISHDIDLVVSSGSHFEKFPNSENYFLEAKYLLAAFEIKKTLSKKHLVDDIQKVTRLKKRIIDDLNEYNSKLLQEPKAIDFASRLFKSNVKAV